MEQKKQTVLKISPVLQKEQETEISLKEGITDIRDYQNKGYDMIHLKGYLNVYRKNFIGSSQKQQFYELDELKCKINIYKDNNDLLNKSKKEQVITQDNEIDFVERISYVLQTLNTQYKKKEASQISKTSTMIESSQKNILDSQNELIQKKSNSQLFESFSQIQNTSGDKKKDTQLIGREEMILQWKQWQEMLWTDMTIGEKLLDQLVTKSKKDHKRFTLFYGGGKQPNTYKLMAQSKEQRDKWILAIKLMIVFHLRMGFMQNQFHELKQNSFQQQDNLFKEKVEEEQKQQNKQQQKIEKKFQLKDIIYSGKQAKSVKQQKNIDVKQGIDASLIEISEYLTKQKSEFQKQFSKMTDLYQIYSTNIDCLEKDIIKTNIDGDYGSRLIDNFEKTKATSAQLMFRHINVLEDVKKLIADITTIVEQFADFEQFSVFKTYLQNSKLDDYNLPSPQEGTKVINDTNNSFNSDQEDLFLDAIGEIQEASVHLNQQYLVQSGEPLQRELLPWLKDPNTKLNLWSMIKDSIGKDISKISLPVVFNCPLSLLQQCACSMEYLHIIDQAALNEDKDPSKRLAIISVFAATQWTLIEKSFAKPFNPILGETFEFVTDDIEFISEQVSHHPPITANFCRSKKTGAILWNNQLTKTRISVKGVDLGQQYRTYIELPNLNEKYEIIAPQLSVHNLIVGSPYVDIGGTMKVNLIGNNELECKIQFFQRGWFQKEAFKLDGDVTIKQGKNTKNLFKINGNWNSNIYISEYLKDNTDSKKQLIDEQTKQCVFKKNEYHEKCSFMYGMSNFTLQLNYFPSWLQEKVAPTDTRRRPDQRYLENGDYIMAAKEKERLEIKQRADRKYREENGIDHVPSYFIQYHNDIDNQTYYVYNYQYFENDRKSQNWNRLPNIFNE